MTLHVNEGFEFCIQYTVLSLIKLKVGNVEKIKMKVGPIHF